MKLVNAVTGVTEKAFECDKAIKDLYIQVTHATALDLSTATLTAKVTGRGKVTDFMTKVPLLFLMEARALTEGAYVYSATIVRGLVELSGIGAVELGTDEKYEFLLEGLQAAATINVWGLENAIVTNVFNKYTKHIIEAAKEEAVIELPSAKPEERPESIIIENNIVSMKIDYMNGRSCEFTTDEMAGIAIGSNDLTYIDSTNKAYIGNAEVIAMQLSGIRRVTLRKSTAATLTYLLVDSAF